MERLGLFCQLWKSYAIMAALEGKVSLAQDAAPQVFAGIIDLLAAGWLGMHAETTACAIGQLYGASRATAGRAAL